MTERAKWSQVGDRIRKKVTDPLSGRVQSIRASSPIEAMARARTVKQTGDALRLGLVSPDEARRIVAANILGSVSVTDLWGRWLRSRPKTDWTAKAEEIWRVRLERSFGALRAWDLTAEKMAEWEAAELMRKVAPKTIWNGYQVIRAVFRVAVRDRAIDRIPWGEWRPQKPPKAVIECCVTIEEFRGLIREAAIADEAAWRRGRYSDLAFRVLVIGFCGLRQGEAAGLGWDDCRIDSEPYTVAVRVQAKDGWRSKHRDWTRPKSPTKGRREEVLRVGAAVVAALRSQRDQLRARGWYSPDGPVFPARGGSWRSHALTIPPSTMRDLARLAGLPGAERWRTHSLRHSFSTLELVASGGDLEAVRQRTRHASVSTLLDYVHPVARAAAKAPFVDDSSIEVPRPALPAYLVEPSEPPALPERAGEDFGAGARAEDRALAGIVGDASRSREQAAEELARAARARRREAAQKTRAKIAPHLDIALALSAEDLARAAAGWCPPEVGADAGRAYAAAYAKERRVSGDVARAAKAGARAKRAKLGAWGRAIRRAVSVRAANGTTAEGLLLGEGR